MDLSVLPSHTKSVFQEKQRRLPIYGYVSHENVRVPPRGKLFFNRKDVHLRQSSQQVCLQYYDEAFTIFLAWSKEIMQKGRRGFRPE